MDRDSASWRALLVNGTVGSGKTETAVRCGELLSATGDRVAVVDLDWLRRAPAPADDPFNLELELANLAAVCATYRAVGVRTIVLVGVLEDPAARARYAQAVASDLRVVRLVVDPSVVQDRLRRRHTGPEASAELRWHLDRAPELETALDAAGLDDKVVETGRLSPLEVARLVLSAVGWD